MTNSSGKRHVFMFFFEGWQYEIFRIVSIVSENVWGIFDVNISFFVRKKKKLNPNWKKNQMKQPNKPSNCSSLEQEEDCASTVLEVLQHTAVLLDNGTTGTVPFSFGEIFSAWIFYKLLPLPLYLLSLCWPFHREHGDRQPDRGAWTSALNSSDWLRICSR